MNKRAFQVVIVALIVVVITGIYIVKDKKDNPTTTNTSPSSGNAAAMPLNVTGVDLAALKGYGIPFMIDFGYEGCIWCQRLEPTLELLHKEWAGKALIMYVDIEKYPDAMKGFKLSAYPTQAFFNADGTAYKPSDTIKQRLRFDTYTKDGQSYTLHVGYLEESDLRAVFAEMGLK